MSFELRFEGGVKWLVLLLAIAATASAQGAPSSRSSKPGAEDDKQQVLWQKLEARTHEVDGGLTA